MPILPKTETVLAELAATQSLTYGSHYGNEPQVGTDGHMIGEVPFDAARHRVTDINPFSLMEMITGESHVRQVIPRQPLNIRIITQHEASRDDAEVSQLKYSLAAALKNSIGDSVPGMTDHVYAYHVGEVSSADIDHETEVIDTKGDEVFATKTVAELCRDGIAVVISDFNRLRLDQITDGYFDATVGVKVNHPSEMSLPANVGIISLGGSTEVNTNKPKQLIAQNERFAAYHQSVEKRLEQVGIKMASVVFDTVNHNAMGFDIEEADKSISAAILRATSA